MINISDTVHYVDNFSIINSFSTDFFWSKMNILRLSPWLYACKLVSTKPSFLLSILLQCGFLFLLNASTIPKLNPCKFSAALGSGYGCCPVTKCIFSSQFRQHYNQWTLFAYNVQSWLKHFGLLVEPWRKSYESELSSICSLSSRQIIIILNERSGFL